MLGVGKGLGDNGMILGGSGACTCMGGHCEGRVDGPRGLCFEMNMMCNNEMKKKMSGSGCCFPGLKPC